MTDADTGMWRVWLRKNPDGCFLEAYKDCGKRHEMERTVRLCNMHQRDIKVLDVGTWTFLTPEQIHAIMSAK